MTSHSKHLELNQWNQKFNKRKNVYKVSLLGWVAGNEEVQHLDKHSEAT
jgi:hypothetical protein